ncbi:Pleiotropic regulator 1, partial [Geodia barretti]
RIIDGALQLEFAGGSWRFLQHRPLQNTLAMEDPVVKHSVHTLVFRSLKRTHDMFLGHEGQPIPEDDLALKAKIACKIQSEHYQVKDLPPPNETVAKMTMRTAPTSAKPDPPSVTVLGGHAYPSAPEEGIAVVKEQVAAAHKHIPTGASVGDIYEHAGKDRIGLPSQTLVLSKGTQQLVPRRALQTVRPEWHPPWKLMRVLSGHLGWVRCIAMEPGNEWFATGSSDRTIKLWELASGRLKLTLTGHISAVRALTVSHRQPYLFSAGEDKQVKCWDLEYNKVVRHYHGHLSGVYCMSLHPTIDVLLTGGRDATARVWDMRTKACIHTLGGHTNTVADILTQAPNPQTPFLRFCFASGSPDNIKIWKLPDGNFLQNFTGHQSIVNTLAINSDGVLVSGGDNGSLHFWDWKTGYNFQKHQTTVQPGSLDSEAGIFKCLFDVSGCRLLTAEADKTIKIYKEDDTATEESHPVVWKPEIMRRKRY